MDQRFLTPELSQDVAAEPLYSVRAGFLVAFFGGPLATTLFSALNSWRQNRLQAELWIFAVGTVLSIGLMVVGLLYPDFFSFGLGGSGGSDLSIVNRILGLTLFGVYYMLHKKRYRAAALFGEDPPSPWQAGIACCLLAAFIYVVVMVVLGEILGLDFLESLTRGRSQ